MSRISRLLVLGTLVSTSFLADDHAARADIGFSYEASGAGLIGAIGGTQAGFDGIAALLPVDSSSVTLQIMSLVGDQTTSSTSFSGPVNFTVDITPLSGGGPETIYDVAGTFTDTYSGGVYTATYSPTIKLDVSSPADLYSLTNVLFVPGNPNLDTDSTIEGTISITSVPEPSLLMMLSLMGLASGISYWLRKRQVAG